MSGDKEVTATVIINIIIIIELLLNASEAVVIDVLGTFHVETVNFVPTFHHGPHIVGYRRSTCLLPRSSDFFTLWHHRHET
jgi:hypothetical protein